MWSAIGCLAFVVSFERPVQLSDTLMFPPYKLVQPQCTFWRTELSQIRAGERYFDTERERQQAEEFAYRMWIHWDILWDITVVQISDGATAGDGYWISRSLEALRIYKGRIGAVRYYQGWTPSPVSLEWDKSNCENWPFTRVRYVDE